MGNKIKGGLADNKTLKDIAMKHSQFIGTMEIALKKGMKVEKEHTDDPKKSKEIAMDHLWEDGEYYDKLEKMESGDCDKVEAKEMTGADASGSFEAGMSSPILKRDIHNFSLKSKPQEVSEMDGIADMAYDAPIGTKQKDPLALDNVSANESASITAASNKDMIATKKGFPRFGGPGAKFVEIKDKCKTFPYCDQMSGLKNLNIKEAITVASKKYGLTVEQVTEMVIKESKQISNKSK